METEITDQWLWGTAAANSEPAESIVTAEPAALVEVSTPPQPETTSAQPPVEDSQTAHITSDVPPQVPFKHGRANRAALETFIAAAFAEGDYKTAAHYGSQLVKVAPNSYEAWFNLGVSFHKLNRTEEAAQAYTEALNAQPDGLPAHVNLGTILQQRGDLSGARKQFERVLETEPGHPVALWNLALLFEKDGHSGKAAELYEQLLRNQRNPQAAFRLGYIRLEAGDLSGAIQAFEACLLERSDWTPARLNLSLAHSRSGDTQLANEFLDQVLSEQPASVDALRLRAALAVSRATLNGDAKNAWPACLAANPDLAENYIRSMKIAVAA